MTRPSDLHDQMIDEWVAEHPGSQRTGFWHTIRKHCRETTEYDGDDDYSCELFSVFITFIDEKLCGKFIPDAYHFDAANKTITLFEAVRWNDITADKWRRLFDFGCAIDGDSWRCHLEVNRRGAKGWLSLCEAWSLFNCGDDPSRLFTGDYILGEAA